MARITGPDWAVMWNLIYIYIHIHTHILFLPGVLFPGTWRYAMTPSLIFEENIYSVPCCGSLGIILSPPILPII